MTNILGRLNYEKNVKPHSYTQIQLPSLLEMDIEEILIYCSSKQSASSYPLRKHIVSSVEKQMILDKAVTARRMPIPIKTRKRND